MNFSPSSMPDVASHDTAELPTSLNWVGMEAIAIPLRIDFSSASSQQVNANSSLYVSLDQPDAKGIHMSRLHLALNERLAGQALTHDKMMALLNHMVQSQEGISQSARVVLAFDLVLDKPALLSGETAFQSYPICIDMQLIEGQSSTQLSLTVPYSSTCPCSASLSRQLYAEAINDRFTGEVIDKQALMNWIESREGSIATPHSQRSYAYLNMSLKQGYLPDLAEIIFQFETMIGTPVQTAVKRQDEQAFARLNAENLMFCEDAARKLKRGLEEMNGVSDYWFKVEHQESLHAHNAVAIGQKYARSNAIERGE